MQSQMISKAESDGETLFMAVRDNQYALAERLLLAGGVSMGHAGNDAKGKERGDRLAHCAVRNNNSNMLTLLVKHDADLTIKNDGSAAEKYTPISLAVTLKHWSCVSAIAKAKKTDAEDKANYKHALICAVIFRQEQAIIDLLGAGAPTTRTLAEDFKIEGIHGVSYYKDDSVLHCAVRNNDPTVIVLLLQYGFDQTVLNTKEFYTAIQLAASLGYWNCVNAFAQTIDTDSKDKAGYGGALLYAVQQGQVAVMDTLLAAGASTAVISTPGETALHLAVKYTFQFVVSSALFNFNNSINAQMIRSLRRYGANELIINRNEKCTPIVLASRNSRWSIVKVFSEQLYTTLPNLIDLVTQVSKTPIDGDLLKLFKQSLPQNKDRLLRQIYNIPAPEIRQKALWQALAPETTLGQLFYLPSGSTTPSIKNWGRLRRIANELQRILKKPGAKLCIDNQVQAALSNMPEVIEIFPQIQVITIGVLRAPPEKPEQKTRETVKTNGADKKKITHFFPLTPPSTSAPTATTLITAAALSQSHT